MHDPLEQPPGPAPLDMGPSIGGISRKRSRGTARTVYASSLMQRPLLDPSAYVKLVRCGVKESCDVTSALTAIIGGMLRDARNHMPRAHWLRCCQLFLGFVDQIAGRGDDAEEGLPEYCSSQLPEQTGRPNGSGSALDAKHFSMQIAIMLQTLCNITSAIMQEDAPEVRPSELAV